MDDQTARTILERLTALETRVNGMNTREYTTGGGGGSGTDPNAVHVNVANEIAQVTAKATPGANDVALIEDLAAGNSKKRVSLSSILTALKGLIDHSGLTNLNSTSYAHLTQAQATDLTDGGQTTLHTHAGGLGSWTGSGNVIQDSWGNIVLDGDDGQGHFHALELEERATPNYPTDGNVRVFVNAAEELCSVNSANAVKNYGGAIGALHSATAGEIAAITEKTSPHVDDLFVIEDSNASNAKKRIKLANISKGLCKCTAYRSTDKTINNNSWTVIDLDAEYVDSVAAGLTAMHDTSTNNSRIYARITGTYLALGLVAFAANSTGVRGAAIGKNCAGSYSAASILDVESKVVHSYDLNIKAAAVVELSAGDYVEMFVWQNSGSGLALKAYNYSPILSLIYLG